MYKSELDYIRDGICEGLELFDQQNNDSFHHNTEYKNILNILKHGILSIKELQKKHITYYTEEQLKKLNDVESHINGIGGISLSKVGLTDIYPNEGVFEPFNPSSVDIIVSSNIKAARNSLHYGNEYICYSEIPISKIISIDFRILQLIENCNYENIKELNGVILKYNYLITAIKKINEYNIPILLKEMSNGNYAMNISKISKLESLPTKNL